MNPLEEHWALVKESTSEELRGAASPEQIDFLWEYRLDWLAELKDLKRRAETQMISGKVRRFKLGVELRAGRLSAADHDTKMVAEMEKRINTFSFIKQIESRIANLKQNGTDSEQTEE